MSSDTDLTARIAKFNRERAEQDARLRDWQAPELTLADIRLLLAEQAAQLRREFAVQLDEKLRPLLVQLAKLENRADRDVPSAAPEPVLGHDETIALPEREKITKIRAQLWFNETPAFRNQAKVQIELSVWTCPPHLMARHQKGNVRARLLIPLHRPDHKEGRKALRAMGLAGLAEQTQAVRMGKLAGTGHIAMIDSRNRLLLRYEGNLMAASSWLDFGLAKLKEDDHAANAPAYTWYYPDAVRAAS